MEPKQKRTTYFTIKLIKEDGDKLPVINMSI